MNKELISVLGLVLYLGIVVLPIVHVVRSTYWEQKAKIGWVVSILIFSLLAYGVFLFITLNRANRREIDSAGKDATARPVIGPLPQAALPEPISIVFVIGRWISILGRVAVIAIAIGILVWVLLHLTDRRWPHRGMWPLNFVVLFIYWIPVEIVGQVLMALGRRLRRAPARLGDQ